ncbi:MAG: hypothetical protein DSM106950_38755 [Stigonema ocellatum SAG 48.90 = DSM 106950]|nr:hypothetical protein [Stigonema ocellatum SAG 48.90 = DSM 106950]
MSTGNAITTYGLRRRIYAIAGTIFLSLTFGGCNATVFPDASIKWKTYSNSRYGFEFPYPSNWTSLSSPENHDGIAFVSPQSNSVEIRGWASHQLPESIIKDKNAKKTISANFQTTQGVPGVLTVEVENQNSEMTVRLTQGQVNYYWRGQCESQDFDHYYRLFYYIAQQYRIEKVGSGE